MAKSANVKLFFFLTIDETQSDLSDRNIVRLEGEHHQQEKQIGENFKDLQNFSDLLHSHCR